MMLFLLALFFFSEVLFWNYTEFTLKKMEHYQLNLILLLLFTTVTGTRAINRHSFFNLLKQGQFITGKLDAELSVKSNTHCSVMSVHIHEGYWYWSTQRAQQIQPINCLHWWLDTELLIITLMHYWLCRFGFCWAGDFWSKPCFKEPLHIFGFGHL